MVCVARLQVQSMSCACKAKGLVDGGDALQWPNDLIYMLQVVFCRQEDCWQDRPAVRPALAAQGVHDLPAAELHCFPADSLTTCSTETQKLAGCVDTQPHIWSAVLHAFILADAVQGPVHPPPLLVANVHTG